MSKNNMKRNNLVLIFSIAILGVAGIMIMNNYQYNKKIEILSNNIEEQKEELVLLQKPSATDIYNSVEKSVVSINNFSTNNTFGSGIIWEIDDDYVYVLTCAHVVDTNQFVVNFEAEESVFGTIEKQNKEKDIALVKVKKSEIPTEVLSSLKVVEKSINDVSNGDVVYAVGNALNYGKSITSGIVSNVNTAGYSIEGMSIIQITAPINSGNSGGALFDENGKLIGLVVAKISDGEVDLTGFAILTKNIEEDLDSEESTVLDNTLLENIILMDVTEEMKKDNIPEGAFVRKIMENNIFYSSGLKNNDIIVNVNDTPITNTEELKKIINNLTDSDIIELTIKRYNYTNDSYEEQTISINN